MPNEQNICSPVTLIANARSGTSLVHRIFEAHPEFSGAGETARVIFGPWYAIDWQFGVIAPTKVDGRELSVDEKATRVVHSTFLTLFRDKKPRWIHKPIGRPEFFNLMARRHGMDAALKWYWHVMNHVFPNGSFITILRNPFDVVLSQEDKFQKRGRRREAMRWKGIAKMAEILTHSDSLNSHAIIYSDLIAEPERVLTKLFTDIDVPFHPRVMKALEKIHAPAPGRAKIDPKATSRSDDWSKLNPEHVTPDIERVIGRLWSKYGARFDVPEHFAERGIRFLDTDGAEAASSISSQVQHPDSAERGVPT